MTEEADARCKHSDKKAEMEQMVGEAIEEAEAATREAARSKFSFSRA